MEPGANVAARPISNSEVTSWLFCTQQYWYGFMLNIEPKWLNDPLTIGNIGHNALQAYADARLEGMNHEQALKAIEDTYWVPLLNERPERIDRIMQVKEILIRYHNYRKGWPEWEILGAEQRHDMPITEEFSLPMRYDLLVREVTSGKIYLVDYKFTYDFWKPEDHELNVQFPKYISILTANGMKVDGAYLEEIRYRSMKDMTFEKHFKRTFYSPSNASRRNSLLQHIKASKQIVKFHAMTPEEQEEEVVGLYNKFYCKGCHFKDLCISKLNGGDITYTIQTRFVDRSYGYEELEDTEVNQL